MRKANSYYCCQGVLRSLISQVGYRLSSRRLVVVVTSCLLVAILAIPHVVSAGLANCENLQPPTTIPVSSGTPTDKRKEAVAFYTDGVSFACLDFCKEQEGVCETLKGCVMSGQAVATVPKCEKDRNLRTWTCTGELERCPCDCFECDDFTPPPGLNRVGSIKFPTQQEAIDNLGEVIEFECEDFCSRCLECPVPPNPTATCVLDGDPTSQNLRCKRSRDRSGRRAEFQCFETITNCPCKCEGVT